MSRLIPLLVPCLIGLAGFSSAQTAEPPALPLQQAAPPQEAITAPPAAPLPSAGAVSPGAPTAADMPATAPQASPAPTPQDTATGAAAVPPAPATAETTPQPLPAAPATVAPSTPAPLQPAAPVLTEATPAAPVPSADVTATPVLPGPAPETLPSVHDLSPMGMYAQAHWVVKGVMLLLVAACFLTWTVWLFKTVELIVAKSRARHSRRVLHDAESLAAATAALSRRRDPAAFMARAVQEELVRSDALLMAAGPEGMKERGGSLVDRIETQALARIRRGTGLLATVGSVAPFVGLFGTVWGIMNSFISIAETKTTNLAVVAPGIAEALFATAIGLVAAIPAVVIYNHFSRSIAAYRLALGDAGAATLRLLSRDIDQRRAREG